MTKREQYDLVFYKRMDTNGVTRKIIAPKTNNSGTYSNLIFINFLGKNEIQYFINTINLINEGKPYDTDFLITNGTEASDLVFINPNFIIDGILTINMLDLQALLQEWLTFLNS